MAAISGAIGLVAAGAISAYGSHKAGQKQKKSQDSALQLAREQEATRKEEWQAQQAAEKQAFEIQQQNQIAERQYMEAQYERQQAKEDQRYAAENAAREPFRQARLAVLSQYGIPGASGGGPQQFQTLGGVGGPRAPVVNAQAAGVIPGAVGAAGVAPTDPQVAGQVIDRGPVAANQLSNWSDWEQYGVRGA